MGTLHRATGAAAALACWIGAAAAQGPGLVVSGPPQDLSIEARAGADGQPIVSVERLTLAVGGYYRLNFVCPEDGASATGFRLSADRLLANAHLRVLSVGGMEVYLQGLTFRAIACDEPGAASFSFHPMRPGDYEIVVQDQGEPPARTVVAVTVE
jgi:hypothetical protein